VGIAERLAGRRFFVTGGTGFLGTALIERIVRTIPGAHVFALVRPTRRAEAPARVEREILRNDCFARLRAELGDRFEEEVARRVTSVAGDVTIDGLGLDDDGWDALAASDVVIHSAATVSFDAPLDQAVEINLLGPSRVASSIAQAAAARGTAPAHLIAVSTAYVAGAHQGETEERLLSDDRFNLAVDWRAEVASARRLRDAVEDASRHANRLREFARHAHAEQGASGTHLLAARAERIREEWVRNQLVEAGSARAKALGWPDVYAFTKALGERALVAQHGPDGDAPVPLTIVRPSIIESALAEPRPGWIRGFRMAEPIILSFARGLLREFPGVPEGIIDVIPVDLVVAALIAIASRGPQDGPVVYHVASGVRNPLAYGELVRLIQDWFGRRPLYDDRGQPISLPQWTFPGRGRVQRQLRQAVRLMALAEQGIQLVPLRRTQAEWAAKLKDRHSMVERALGYAELYGAYTETEALYRIDRLLELFESLDPADQQMFCFDPAVIDWAHYVADVHLPSVVERGRVRTTPGRSASPDRQSRLRAAVLSGERHLAVFDLEHTLVASNVVDSYAWLASRHLPSNRKVTFVADLLASAPRWLSLDRRDRGDFLRFFYRRYEGAPVQQIAQDAWDLFHEYLLARCFPDGIARVREHRRLGHRTLLVTGALDLVVAPLRPLFDDVVCAHLSEEAGVFTGHLSELSPTGEARALLLDRYAREHGLSLSESVAYADSVSDLAMLEAVGFPVAVNPDSRLAAIARRRGWLVEHWSRAPGGTDQLLPLARAETRSVRTYRRSSW